jgi:carboxyl-terminal processing protease
LDSRQQEKYNIIQPLLLAACIAVGMMLGYKMNDNLEKPLIQFSDASDNNPQMIGRVEELLRFIENKYVDSVNSNVLIDEAISAIFAKLDPHSSYLSATDVEDVNDEMSGSFQGIGIENFSIDDTICIYRVLNDSPAAKADLRPFDRLITIDDSIIAGKSIPYANIRQKLRKKSGETFELTILRGKQLIKKKISAIKIPVRTVQSTFIPEASAAIIKIDRFGAKTYAEFMTEVEKYFADIQGKGITDKAKHLIIDLRDNPGGYLPEATNILCQIFEEKDRLLVYTEGKSNQKNEYKTTGKRFFAIEKVIILIDENSASASEIVAGAIQDWDRGIVIGRRSYGKGLVQEQYDLNNGGAVRLTVARYYTPSGRSIQRTYDDRDNYDEDLSERVKNGDLFHKDSTIVKDAQEYKTLLLNRKVRSVGGITPDVFVGMDTIYRNIDFMLLKSYLPEFVCRYSIHRIAMMPSNEANLKSWSVPKDFYTQLLSYVSQKEDKIFSLPASKLNFLEHDIKDAVANMVMGTDRAQMYQINTDPFVQQAISTLRSGITLAQLK